MTPTPKLRWVEKQLENFEIVEVFAQGNFSYRPRKLRVLQQWWEDTFGDLADGVTSYGEWRDVPVEKGES